MGVLNDDAQIVKGNVQEGIASVKKNTGDEMGGLVEDIKGKANRTIGKMKKDFHQNQNIDTTRDNW